MFFHLYSSIGFSVAEGSHAVRSGCTQSHILLSHDVLWNLSRCAKELVPREFES